jgi:hypothetical protein
MQQLSNKNNFIYLFFALLIFLFSAAIIADFPNSLGEDFLTAVILLMILVSIKSLRIDKSWRWALGIFGFSFFAVIIFVKFFVYSLFVYLILSLLLVFFISAFILIVKEVLFEGDIDANKIIGSLSLYILLGLSWAVVYLFLLLIDPGTFSGIEISNWQGAFSRVAYYSFVTLTTLGYGDILPTNHIAEFFVYLEAVCGVFYMAIIVSSLIALRLDIVQKEREGK